MDVEQVVGSGKQGKGGREAIAGVQVAYYFRPVGVFIFYILVLVGIGRHLRVDAQTIFAIAQDFDLAKAGESGTDGPSLITVFGIQRQLAGWRRSQDKCLFPVA